MDNKIITKSKRKLDLLPSKIDLKKITKVRSVEKDCAEVLFLTTYPPRECGIATYSKDLLSALNAKFGKSLKLSITALEDNQNPQVYPDTIESTLNTASSLDYIKEANRINTLRNIDLVLIQHEFGLFAKNEFGFLEFLKFLDKPIAITFHTVMPKPNMNLRENVIRIASFSRAIIVMTETSAKILMDDYGITKDKIVVIPHGTHLISYSDNDILKAKYKLSGMKVLSTFGLLGPGKSIETTLEALPEVLVKYPETIFLILGRTHPTLMRENGEVYREFLENKVHALGLENNVRFVNMFLPLNELLEYLQLTDVYLFTSKDPNQAVSGTFSYATSCGCPVISTPIPHALEVLQNNAGTIFDFEDSGQLEQAIVGLLDDEVTQVQMSINGLSAAATTCWENAAIAHAKVFERLAREDLKLKFEKPPVKLEHIKKMTTKTGIIQFSQINQPDIETGYTLDDNARALIAFCQHYKLTGDKSDLEYIKIYFNFVSSCFRSDGRFLNYVDKVHKFTDQNDEVNLEDSCGRALWALGYLISVASHLPKEYYYIEDKARFLFEEGIKSMQDAHSTRAMAFMVKGLYYYNQGGFGKCINSDVHKFADRLLKMYLHENTDGWRWYESYLTYGNSVLPQAMLMAYLMTLQPVYRRVAQVSFDFLLSKIFVDGSIRVVSNRNWLRRGEKFDTSFKGGEQPIDIAYTIFALGLFHKIFPELGYDKKMEQAFNWFMGDNPLGQTIYNPCTGGCYDGLELYNVNLNQGAESTISYLLSRMAFEEDY